MIPRVCALALAELDELRLLVNCPDLGEVSGQRNATWPVPHARSSSLDLPSRGTRARKSSSSAAGYGGRNRS